MHAVTNALSPSPPIIRYDGEIEEELSKLIAAMVKAPALASRYPARWLAIQLLEGTDTLLQEVGALEGGREVLQVWQSSVKRLRARYGDDIELVLADQRYGFAHNLVEDVLTRTEGRQRSASDKIDQVVTHHILGIPIFLTLMYLVFNLVQNVAAPYLDWMDGVIAGPITHWAVAILSAIRAPEWLTSLVVEGAIAGVGGVLVFVPGLMVMFFALAVLEDSGYMARAAFVMDRFMSLFGLHGKSFMPMVVGFGCNVPAIYATRTIENQSARTLTALMVPFMSCSARLPIYVVFGLAFFPRNAGQVILGLYLLGIVVAALVGVILSRTAFRGQQRSAFLMELPPYHRPMLRGLWNQTWQRTSHFVRKAGTIILAVSIVIWFLVNLPWGVEEPRHSLYGQVSAAIAPVFQPAGFGQWEATGSLITGFIAKEMVISTLSEVYVGAGEEREIMEPPTLIEGVGEIVVDFGAATVEATRHLIEVATPGITVFGAGETEEEDTALSAALKGAFTPLAAFAFMVFVLLYVPCVATVSAQAQEFGWKWAGISVAIQIVVPWTLAALIYQGGRLLGLG